MARGRSGAEGPCFGEAAITGTPLDGVDALEGDPYESFRIDCQARGIDSRQVPDDLGNGATGIDLRDRVPGGVPRRDPQVVGEIDGERLSAPTADGDDTTDPLRIYDFPGLLQTSQPAYPAERLSGS